MENKIKKLLKDILILGVIEHSVQIFLLFNNSMYVKIGQARFNLLLICFVLCLQVNIRIADILYTARKSEKMDKKIKKLLTGILILSIFEFVMTLNLLFDEDFYFIIGQARLNLLLICVILGLLINIIAAIILYSGRKSENKQEN